MKNFKIYALPYAGGLSSMYYDLKKELLSSGIELIPLEYSGHGSRMDEPLYENIEDITQDIYNQIQSSSFNEPYAILGYSMGCLIAYELYYKLLYNNKNLPSKIFFCSLAFPITKKNEPDYSTLSNNEFIEKLKELGGTSNELLESEELLDIFLPQIRADFIANTSYINPKYDRKITSDGIVIYGKKEFSQLADLLKWNELLENPCTYNAIDGSHFFIHEHCNEIKEIIFNTTKTLLK